jgi:hypothetical protein
MRSQRRFFFEIKSFRNGTADAHSSFQANGRIKQMDYSTFSILTTGAILAAVLAAADWYVWGLTYASDFRQPHRVKPQDSDEGHGFKQVA